MCLIDNLQYKKYYIIQVLSICLLVVLIQDPAVAFGRDERQSDYGKETDLSKAAGDLVVLDEGQLRIDASVKVRGRINIYGNVPFTFYAIRTEVAPEILRDAGHLRHDGSEYDTDEPVPWLLELEAPDRIRLNDWQGQTVVVTGYLRRLPAGPRHGLLEVRSIEAAP